MFPVPFHQPGEAHDSAAQAYDRMHRTAQPVTQDGPAVRGWVARFAAPFRPEPRAARRRGGPHLPAAPGPGAEGRLGHVQAGPWPPCGSSTAGCSSRGEVVQDIRAPRPRAPVAGRAQLRGSAPLLRCDPVVQAPHRADDRLRRGPADLGGRLPARGGHRQPADGDPRPAGQGEEGPLRDALAAAAGGPPALLVGRPAED